MKTLWQAETGSLECRWSSFWPPDGQRPDEHHLEAPENSVMRGSYLPPLPNFASHSPFGGATWFYPNPANCILTQS